MSSHPLHYCTVLFRLTNTLSRVSDKIRHMENNLNRLSGGIIQESPTGVTVQTESPCPPHYEFTETDPTENQINERLQPKTPFFCHKDSDYDRSKDTPNFSLKLSTFKDKLFSEPISPIVSLQPGENQVVRPNTRPLTPANSTLNASGEELKEKDSVEGCACASAALIINHWLLYCK